MKRDSLPTVLTVATSDSGAGAGIQADLLTFAAHRVFGVSALAALTAQNPDGVSRVAAMEPHFLKAQLKSVEAFFPVKAVKVGMLFNAGLIEEAVAFLRRCGVPVVVDPVMVASSGARLLEAGAQRALVERLLPLATVLTPNLDEAAVLLDSALETAADLRAGARRLVSQFQTAVLLKGGHLPGEELLDVLMLPDGTLAEFVARRVPDLDTHGSGCTLSAAIAAQLGLGLALPEAVGRAHAYLQAAMREAVTVGGRRFINHFPEVFLESCMA